MVARRSTNNRTSLPHRRGAAGKSRRNAANAGRVAQLVGEVVGRARNA
jgi:hypothetical protein